MDIEEIVDNFYKENIQKGIYCQYDNCEIEVDELIFSPEVFKDNLRSLLKKNYGNIDKCSD